MAFVRDAQRIGLGFATIAASATLLWFGSGLHPWWPLMWFAPLPVLLVAARATAWEAALVALSAWFAGTLNLWKYLHDVLHLPSVTVIMEFMLVALAFTIAVLAFRTLARRGESWSALIAYPAVWVSFEYIFNRATSAGTLISLAYSQLKFLPLLQVAAVTGPWGMSFLVLLLPTAIALFVRTYRTRRRHALRLAGASFAVIAAALIFGAIRLAIPIGGQQVTVGMVVHDAWRVRAGHQTTRLIGAYADQAVLLAARGAQVVILPEKIGTIVEPASQAVDSRLQAVANHTNATLIAGLVHVTPHRSYNEARIYSPGGPVREYHKEHLLVPFESQFTPGRRLVILKRPSGLWGIEICKDMDFTGLSRHYGEAGVGLMLVPAWDFRVDWIEHGHAALMRGVEDGFSVARAAKYGSLYVSDNRGRILAEVMSDSARFATLVAEVPVAHAATPYLLFGNWFAWLALLGALATLSRALRRTQHTATS
jgi:apolipoprotein N-acyltransferase